MEIFLKILFVVLAYLIGSIPFGLLIGKMKGIDVRKEGSGNVGATNCGRLLGKKYAIIVYLLDMFKAGILVFLFRYSILPNEWCLVNPMLYGLVAFIGNAFPVWLKFKGGKGVACGSGAVIGYCPILIVPILIVFFIFKKVTKLVSASSLISTYFVVLVMVVVGLVTHQFLSNVDPTLTSYPYGWYPFNYWAAGFTLLMAVIITIRHTANIKRMMNGTEKPANY